MAILRIDHRLRFTLKHCNLAPVEVAYVDYLYLLTLMRERYARNSAFRADVTTDRGYPEARK